MSCQEFEQIVLDVARGRLMDAAVRHSGLAHADECARCAARLADERALTTGLRALAATERAERHAPARVEANLLAALRERRAAEIRTAPVSARAFAWGRWAAVAALLAVALTPLSLWRSGGENARGLAETNRSLANVAEDWRLLVVNKQPPVVREPAGRRLIRPAALAVNPAPAQLPRPVRVNRSGDVANRELTTEFFPLNGAGSFPATDEVQMVRVQLPRSALGSFGLPYSAERGNERVTADVIIGADGIARAVRFVR
jgi:hypothetical protein